MKMVANIKRYLLCAALSLIFTGVSAQQTLQFTQYMFTGMTVNPAYAGYKEDWTANLNYRLQWAGLAGAPRTGTLSVDGVTDPVRKNMALGLLLTSDQLGPEMITSAYANYSYRIRLDEPDTKRLSLGFGIGVVKYSLDASKFSATNISDGAVPAGDAGKFSPDIRAGAYYYSPQFYIGASVINLLSSGIAAHNTITRQLRHFYLTAGGMIPLTAYLDWKPSFLYKDDFKGPANLDLSSSLLIKKKIWAGLTYRTGINFFNRSNSQDQVRPTDALAVILEMYCSTRLRLGYSHDFTTSRLAGSQNGSHEIALCYTLGGRKARILSPRYF